ncbi:tetratricopeptide repeat protein [Elusimicrobiota bacterium]
MNTKRKSTGPFAKTWLIPVILAIAVFAIYSNSLHAPFVFDDKPHIVENHAIRNLDNFITGGFNASARAVTFLSFALNYHFGKLNTFGYHIVNIALHILNCFLVFFLTKKIIFYVYNRKDNLASFLIALIFAVQPINSEVVVNICRRTDSLSAVFFLSSILFFIKTFEKKRIHYFLSLIAFILALFSKESSATLPAIILLIDYFLLSDFDIQKVIRKKYYHLGFWIILVLYVLFHLVILSPEKGIGIDAREIGPQIKWTRISYLTIQLFVVLRYLKILLVPGGLSLDHWVLPARTVFDPRIVVSIFVILCLIITCYIISRKKRDTSKLTTFLVLWAIIIISPASSIFLLGNAMADRRAYLPGLSACFLIVFVYMKIYNSVRGRRRIRFFISVFFGIYILFLGTTTFNRSSLYNNRALLWKDVIIQYPDNFRAHNNLGVLYEAQKKYDKAFQEYQKALEIYPDYAKGHNNLGVLYEAQKKYDKAFQEHQKALEIYPDYAKAYNNIGLIYHHKKEYGKAFQKYQKAIKLDPNFAAAHFNLAVLYKTQKKYDEALQEYQKALKFDPYYTEAYSSLGVLYMIQKEYDKALQAYRKALEINPDFAEAYSNLGLLFYEIKRYDKAFQEYQKVLR